MPKTARKCLTLVLGAQVQNLVPIILLAMLPQIGSAEPSGTSKLDLSRPVPSKALHMELLSWQSDCEPRWTKKTPVDSVFLYVPAFGSGRTQEDALAEAEAVAVSRLAMSLYGVARSNRAYYSRVGPDTVERVQLFREISGEGIVSGAAAPRHERSDVCFVGGRHQVWVLRGMSWTLFQRRLAERDPLARDFDFRPEIAAYVRAHRPRSVGSRVAYSLVPGGGLQYEDGNIARGRFVRWGSAIGAAAGTVLYLLAERESDNAHNELSSTERRDYYNQQADRYYRLSLGAWTLAGVSYAFGIVDAFSGGR